MKRYLFTALWFFAAMAAITWCATEARAEYFGHTRFNPKAGYWSSTGAPFGGVSLRVCTQTADDTTPSMGLATADGCNILLTSTSHSGGVSITNLDDVLSGIDAIGAYEQRILIIGQAAANQTTISDGGNFVLKTIPWDSPASGDHSVLELKTVYMTGSITAFANGGGGQVVVTATNTLQENQTVVISGTTNYNGTFTATSVTGSNFEITDTWVSDDGTGTWVSVRFDETSRSGNVDDYFYQNVYVNYGNATDFANSQLVVGESNTGTTSITAKNAIAGEASADGSNPGVGILGYGETSSAQYGAGGMFLGIPDATGDTTTAYGARTYAQTTHAGGANVGLYSRAVNGATNYALQIEGGDINTITAANWLLLDDSATALTWDAAGAADILTIITTDGEETVAHASKLTGSSALDAGTGDEYAWDLAYETNKATSGDSYGLRIVHTATAVPASAYLLSITGTGSMVLDTAGDLTLDSGAAATHTTTFAYNTTAKGKILAESADFKLTGDSTTPVIMQSEDVTGTSASGAVSVTTGAQGNAGDYDSGDVTIYTGATTTDGDTGDVTIKTGAAGAGAGDAGDFVVQTHGANTRLTIAGNGGDATFTADVDIEGYAAIGDGSALNATGTLIVDRDFSTATNGSQLRTTGVITVTGGSSSVAVNSIAPEGVILNDGGPSAHAYVSSLEVSEPTITETVGTATVAATVHIVDAPTEGDTNWALHVDAGDSKMDEDLTVDGTVYAGALSMSGDIDVNDFDIIDPSQIYQTAQTSDAAADDLDILAGNAYEEATGGNQAGADLNLASGIGTRQVTIDDYNNCGTDTVTVTIDGTANVLTEGSEWTAASDNDTTATSLASAIDALTGVSASATAAVVYIVPDEDDTFAVDLDEGDATCTTLTEGTDGSVVMHSSYGQLKVEATDVAIDRNGASVDSPKLALRGDNAGNEVEGSWRLAYGAQPYMIAAVDDDGTSPSPVDVLHLDDNSLRPASAGGIAVGDATNYFTNFIGQQLHLNDSGDDHQVVFDIDEDNTGNKTLSLKVNDGDRTVDLSGNLTVESASTINQDLSTDSTSAQLADLSVTSDLSVGDVLNQAAVTIADGDTTPDVSGGNLFVTSANTGATAITDLDNPVVGQVLHICGGSNTNSSTITDGGNFALNGDMELALDECITLEVQADNDYVELGRNNVALTPWTSDVDAADYDLVDVSDIYRQAPTSDTAASDLDIIGENAYAQATGASRNGGDVNIAAGIRTLQIVCSDRTLTDTDTITITVDGADTVLTESTDFDCEGEASEEVCCDNIGAAITTAAIGITPDCATTAGTCYLTLDDDDILAVDDIAYADGGVNGTGWTLTEGTDGSVNIHTGYGAVSITPTALQVADGMYIREATGTKMSFPSDGEVLHQNAAGTSGYCVSADTNGAARFYQADCSSFGTIYLDATEYITEGAANKVKLFGYSGAGAYLSSENTGTSDIFQVMNTVTTELIRSSGDSYGIRILPVINQTGTAGHDALHIDVDDNGRGSGDHFLINTLWNGSPMFQVEDDGDTNITGDLVVSGTGPHAFGDTVYDYSQLKLGGNFTSGGADQHAEKILVQGTLTGASGDTQRLSVMDVMGGITTQTAEESIGLAAQAIFREPQITDQLGGAGVVTDAATVYIEAAPTEGSVRNAALLVDNGATILDGTLQVGAEATFLNNAAAATFGDVTTDADVVLAFDAVTAQGSITYMEDEDRFDFDNDMDVIGDLTAGTVTSDGAISGTNVSASVTLTAPSGTDLPATCAAGEIFLDTDDDSCADVGGGSGAFCGCTAANTWGLLSQ